MKHKKRPSNKIPKIITDGYLSGFEQKKTCDDCCRCSYPLPKCKKYRSYGDLLFDKKVCEYIERGRTCLPYRDTQERLLTQRARAAYSSKIGPSGLAHCKRPYYYPKN